MQRAIKRSFVVAAILWSCVFIGTAQACTAPNCTPPTGSVTEASVGKPLALIQNAKRRSPRVKKTTKRHQAKRTSVKSTAKPAIKAAKTKSTTKTTTRAATKTATKTAKTATEAAPGSTMAAAESVDAKAWEAAAPARLAPGIADARAELTQDHAPLPHPAATHSEADKPAEAASGGVQISTADQFNAIDRDMIADASASAAPALVMPVQAASVPDSQPGLEQSVSSQDGAWDQASLVGKIFIALGTVLALASAARMLIA